jgi:uncharacterized protein
VTNQRKRIGLWFEILTKWIYRHCWSTLVVMVILVTGLAAGMTRLTIDTSTEGFLHADDPTLKTYEAFKDQFGRDDLAIVAVEAPELFGQTALRKLKALHDDLEENVPHLNDIVSMVNARNTRGEGDLLIVEDLLEHWPATPEQLAALKNRVMSNPLYRNRLISEDGLFTTIALEIDAYSESGEAEAEDVLAGFGENHDQEGDQVLAAFDEAPAKKPPYLTDEENRAAVEAIQAVLAKHQAADFKLYLAGMPVVTNELKRSMTADMGLFMRLAVLTIGVCLFIMFRRFSGVILPFLIVVMALISTLGLMGYAGVSVKLPTMILPSFLLAVGVCAVVHVLALFYPNLQRSGDKESSIAEALGHSGLAIVLTSLTTAAGLGSFCTAEVAPIANLGVFAGLGVMLALMYTILLLPALLAIIPLKAKPNRHEAAESGASGRILDTITDFSTGHPRTIMAVSAVVIAILLAGTVRIVFSHNVLAWLPREWPVRQATVKIDDVLKGTVVVEVIYDSGRENGLYDPDKLKALDRLAREVEAIEHGSLFVGKAFSVADILKEIHQALNENRPDFYVVPDDAKLIPQEFLLFENSGSGDLEDVIDSGFRQARFTAKVPWRDALEFVPLLEDIRTRFHEALGTDAEITITGLMALLSRTTSAAVHSMAKSYVIAFVVITLMMILLIGDLKLGLISMIPGLAPIIAIVGLIGWTPIPFHLFTMLIGSIAFGLTVDNTIHFMHNFRRYHGETGDVIESVRRTLHTTGRALLVTNVVLSLGFFVFVFAAMNNVVHFGILTGLTIVLAFLAIFLMGPALMVLTHRQSPVPTADGSQFGGRT